MSRLEELIEELCPDGVEYKKLRNFATITRGGNFQKKNFTEKGVPCIHYGQIYTHFGIHADQTITYINEEVAKKSKYAKKNDIVMAVTSENLEDVCKCVAWLGCENIAISGHTAIIKHNQNPKFLSYYFHTSMFFSQKGKLAHGTKVIEVTPNKLLDIVIPLPSIEVQNEIVRILDNFTGLTAALTAELTAELTARKKQYEFYRRKMLLFDEQDPSVNWISMGEVYDFQYGKGNRIPQGTGKYPVYGSNGIVGSYDEYNSENSPVIGHIGAYAGIVNWGEGKHFVTYNGVICKLINNNILSKYGYYLLLLQNYLEKAKNDSQPFVSYDTLKQPIVPIPTIEEQKRIVDILERFDILYNDITVGLPSEIEARRKQYEYYREKLLTFKELGVHNV